MAHDADSVTEVASIDAPVDVVFDRIARWCGGGHDEVKHCEILDGARGEDATVLYKAALGRLSVEYVLRYELERPNRVRYELVRSPLLSRLDGDYVLEESGGTTQVTYSLHAALKVPLPGMVKRRIGRVIVERALHDLKRSVEDEAT